MTKSDKKQEMPFTLLHKSKIVLICFLVLSAIPSSADFVYLNNGEVLIGTIKQTTSKGVLFDTYKGDVEVELSQILRTESSLETIRSLPLSIRLKDSSVLRGTVVDLDSEIGVFLDITFGTLTVPFNGIEQIFEVNQTHRYNGKPFRVSAGGGMYLPVLDSGKNFNASWITMTSFHLSLPWVRGLYAGMEAAFLGAEYTKTGSTDYYFVAVSPALTYKYLNFRLREGILRAVTPFASVFLGPGYVHISDPNLYPSSYGSLDLYFGARAGTEIALSGNFSLELSGLMSAFLQKGNPFTIMGGTLSIGYDY